MASVRELLQHRLYYTILINYYQLVKRSYTIMRDSDIPNLGTSGFSFFRNSSSNRCLKK